jgi:hypothetical protein
MKFRNEPAPSFPFLKARQLVFHFQISRLYGRNKKCRRVVERERVSICRSSYLIESRLYFGIAIPGRTIMHWYSCKNVLQGLRDIVQAIKPRIPVSLKWSRALGTFEEQIVSYELCNLFSLRWRERVADCFF